MREDELRDLFSRYSFLSSDFGHDLALLKEHIDQQNERIRTLESELQLRSTVSQASMAIAAQMGAALQKCIAASGPLREFLDGVGEAKNLIDKIPRLR